MPAPEASEPMARRRVVLCCRACGAEVTTPAQAISVRDAHEHHVFNPAGVLFLIGCFAEAPGVRPVGPRSDQFTWFPGHTWTWVRGDWTDVLKSGAFSAACERRSLGVCLWADGALGRLSHVKERLRR